MKKPSTQVRLDNAVTRIFQLENDLAAARKREEGYRDTEVNLHQQLAGWQQRANLADATINQYRHERDDWRDAFKLIMKLVK